jgi:UDPglucose 6-dehydrogenase
MSLRICVYGLWHLGSVTAACLAEHFATVGYDPASETIAGLLQAHPPISEPGLAELIAAGLSSGRLSFSSDSRQAVENADIIWVTFDTPVDADDVADVEFVRAHVEAMFPFVQDGALVLVSSQVPVGFTASVERAFLAQHSGRRVSFAYSPENLRLGKALDSFRKPERIVVGARTAEDRTRLSALFAPFTRSIEWMSVESAEMTKHALNAFLATSVAFINELAGICEQVGADAKQVERGLKSEPRIGPKAYLRPGVAFGGGTLARDVSFLVQIAQRHAVPAYLFPAVIASNNEHKTWPKRVLARLLGDLTNKRIAVLGLTYKAGTDTLRRSGAVELCLWLSGQGAEVRAFDPAVPSLPPDLSAVIRLCRSTAEAVDTSDAMVIATEWPIFKELSADELVKSMRTTIVLDPNRFLAPELARDPRLRYAAVGVSS